MLNRNMREKLCLMKQIQNLWEQHVYWTRFFIISTASELSDLKPVTDRLLRNPKDFAKMLEPFLGMKNANIFQELFTEHLTIAAELVNAAKNKNIGLVNDARDRWYENSDEIARFFSCVNQCWEESKWKSMLYCHLEMTEKEAVLRLNNDYSADIEMFNQIELEALRMADYMFCGIIHL